MKYHGNVIRTMLAILSMFALQSGTALADSESDSFKHLSAQWWQWALSIPVVDNPLLDTSGEKCMVGQRGENWFLAGFFGSGAVARTCSVPEGTRVFFPVVNSINLDVPNVCGQGPGRVPVADLRAGSAAFINGVSNASAELDGQPIKRVRRVQSSVFAAALPEDNLFDAPCASLGYVAAGVYSPAVDDGLYVQLKPLSAGRHTLHFHAENTSQALIIDVTYTLNVVPTLLK